MNVSNEINMTHRWVWGRFAIGALIVYWGMIFLIWPVSRFLFNNLNNDLTSVIAGAIAGSLFGLIQFRVIKRHHPVSLWIIPAELIFHALIMATFFYQNEFPLGTIEKYLGIRYDIAGLILGGIAVGYWKSHIFKSNGRPDWSWVIANSVAFTVFVTGIVGGFFFGAFAFLSLELRGVYYFLLLLIPLMYLLLPILYAAPFYWPIKRLLQEK